MRKYLIGLLASIAMIGSAHAGLVYETGVGDWNVRGWREAGKLSCVASTYWHNPEGQLNINVFPRGGDDFYLTMTLLHPDATTRNLDDGVTYDTDIIIINEGVRTKYTAQYQRYGDKIIFRNLSFEFLADWSEGETLIFFENTDVQLAVSLSGTRAAVIALVECLDS